MDVKIKLNQIRQMRMELAAMELSLAEVRDQAIGQGSPALDKLNIMTSLPSDPMAEAIIEYSDMLDEYHQRRMEFNRSRTYLMRTLKKYVSGDELTMLVMRYFEGKSYGEIGRRFNLDYHHTQTQIRWIIHQIDRK